ncbi:hypothetical protein [Paraburkholderia sp. JHI869]|uniref:hypothetical protein n=1 Tax=Paraburkholderia sp. JHI869 TaxID=3112959 RepID=UPI00316D203E
MSANPIHRWLEHYDFGKLDVKEAAANSIAEYDTKIAALERKVGQPALGIDVLK